MRNILLCIALLAGHYLPGQTLDDYLAIARENNPGIRAKQTEYQAALQRLPQARALPDPQISGSFFIRPMMLPMGNQLGSISAMQMFPWFGTLDAMETEAVRMAEVKSQTISVAENELAFKVKSAWYPLLELEEQLRIQRENLRVLETDKELATIKFQQGKAPMVDAIRTDIMIDELKTGIALLEQKRQPLVAAFNRLLNRDPETPAPVTDSLPEPASDSAIRRDNLIGNNPGLVVFDRQIAAAAAEQTVADKMRFPMIGAGLQYMPLAKRNGGDLPPNTGADMVMPMFSVTVPIWRKKYDAAVEERRLMQQMYADMKTDMHNELAAMYEMTWYEVEKTTQMIDLLNTQMTKTQQAIDLLLAAYSNAGQDFEEILRLQQQLFRYRLEKISMQTENQLALAKLDYLTGQ